MYIRVWSIKTWCAVDKDIIISELSKRNETFWISKLTLRAKTTLLPVCRRLRNYIRRTSILRFFQPTIKGIIRCLWTSRALVSVWVYLTTTLIGGNGQDVGDIKLFCWHSSNNLRCWISVNGNCILCNTAISSWSDFYFSMVPVPFSGCILIDTLWGLKLNTVWFLLIYQCCLFYLVVKCFWSSELTFYLQIMVERCFSLVVWCRGRILEFLS